MGMMVCGIENCYIRKYEFCYNTVVPPSPAYFQNIVVRQDGPILGSPQEPFFQLTDDFGPSGVPAGCGEIEELSGFTVAPLVLGSDYLLLNNCTSPFACFSCVFIEPGINKWNPSLPTIAPFSVENVANSAVNCCLDAFVIRFACNWKGRLCMQFCCDEQPFCAPSFTPTSISSDNFTTCGGAGTIPCSVGGFLTNWRLATPNYYAFLATAQQVPEAGHANAVRLVTQVTPNLSNDGALINDPGLSVNVFTTHYMVCFDTRLASPVPAPDGDFFGVGLGRNDDFDPLNQFIGISNCLGLPGGGNSGNFQLIWINGGSQSSFDLGRPIDDSWHRFSISGDGAGFSSIITVTMDGSVVAVVPADGFYPVLPIQGLVYAGKLDIASDPTVPVDVRIDFFALQK